jgi:hypothetical protein
MAESTSQTGGLVGKLRIVGIAATVVAALGLVGFSKFMAAKVDENWVTFTNSLDTPGDVIVDGKSQGALQPRAELRVKLDGGSHTVAFQSGGKTVEEGKIDINKKGYHALYNVGGKPGLAMVTMQYGNTSLENSVAPIPEGQRLIEVPMTFQKINDPFPESLTTNGNMSSTARTNVCRIDKDKVGCPGWE